MSKLIILFLLSICFISCNHKSSADIKWEDSVWFDIHKNTVRIQYVAMKNQQALMQDIVNYKFNLLKCCECCKSKKSNNDKSK